jgi:hypothetical protein
MSDDSVATDGGPTDVGREAAAGPDSTSPELG